MTNLAPFFRLYERTSAKGRTYLAGRLGMAKVVAFRGEADDGTPTWEVHIDTDQTRPHRAAAARPDPGKPAWATRPAARQTNAAHRALDREADAAADRDGFDWAHGDPLPPIGQ